MPAQLRTMSIVGNLVLQSTPDLDVMNLRHGFIHAGSVLSFKVPVLQFPKTFMMISYCGWDGRSKGKQAVGILRGTWLMCVGVFFCCDPLSGTGPRGDFVRSTSHIGKQLQ